MTLSVVLFDFNGVLVDDEHLHMQGFNTVLERFGIVLSDEVYAAEYLGFDDRGAFTAALRAHAVPFDDALIAALIAEKAAVYAQRATRELRIFPGASALLGACAARASRGIGIVSGALRAEIDLALGVLGAGALVRHIVAAEDVTACKPDPEGYLRALALFDIDAASRRARAGVVVLEDSLAGIAAGVAAGLTVAAVAHSYPAQALRDAGARVVFPELSAVRVEALAELTAD